MKNLHLFYYSPTGTTQKVVQEIGNSLDIIPIAEKNLTQPGEGAAVELSDSDLVIIGMPVYSGRLPETGLERLKNIHANGTPAVVVVVYGNRDYDDALLELSEVAAKSGFVVVAGAAFIGEHSYSTPEKPIAKDRPDQQDLEKCSEFAQLITKKISAGWGQKTPQIPGNHPYKERKPVSAEIHPETDEARCSKCGICVEACPTDAITLGETLTTNGHLCTLCCACVKVCPDEARIFDHPAINTIKDRLFANCSARREPEYFL